MGDQGLQPDMHLKPLDNAALLKPLRKQEDVPAAPDAPGEPEAAPITPPPQESAPIIPETPKAASVPSYDSYDDDEEDLFSLPKSAAVKPVEEPVFEPDDNEDEDEVSAPAAPPKPVAPQQNLVIPPTLPLDEDDEDEDDENRDEIPAPPPLLPEDDDEDEDEVPAPPEPAPEPETPVDPPTFSLDGEEDEDESWDESPQPEPDNEPDDTPGEPAQKPPTSYRPTDEQVHMMELMKSIFASALNAGPSGVQPPAAPPPEPRPSMGDLREELMALQQEIRAAEIPVVIVIEGLSASGKGTMLSKLVEGLDSRGYQAHPIRKPNCVEETYPLMRRYWMNMPKKGHIALFCSSWYSELDKTCMAHEDEIQEILPQRLNEIISMESQLVCDGALILKFFLHISRQEQYDRLQKMEHKKSTTWHVVADDYEQNKHYDEYMKGMDNLMSITNLRGASWHILDATDLKACGREIYETVIRTFKDTLQARKSGLRPWDVPMLPNLSPISSLGFPPLKTIDLDKHLDVPYKSERKKLTKKLKKLQEKLYRKGIPLITAFEGWDAAGKGGAISRLISALDARGYDVAPISSPTPLELSHHYLWRFFRELPPKGHITVFDRTWYGRVMVERVEGFCTQPQWQRAYEEINRFEKLWTDSGGILCKFWLQIDEETQLERFNDRKEDPEKEWKLTDEDWRNRDKWPQYEQAVDEVLQRTHTAHAPWTVVEANDKEYARIKVLKTVIAAIEKRLDQEDKEDE